MTGDSLRFLTLQDTVILEISKEGEKVFYHTLEEGQTLFSMARFYGLRLEDIYFYNPHLKNGYKPGNQVKVPIPNKAIRRFRSPTFISNEWVPLMYEVKKGDTFYGISNRHFKLPVDTIYKRNNLYEDPYLKLGQRLHVGWMSIYGIPDSLRAQHSSPLWRKSHQLKKQFVINSYNKKKKKEKGAAFWDINKTKANKLYALHNTAKVGSIIAVTNLMYNRTVYAKVIGRISERTHGADVKVVVSPTVAKMLGAKDPRFYVSVKSY